MRLDKARESFERHDFDSAYVEAEELLDDYPTHPEGLCISGQAALAMGDALTAVAALTQYDEAHEANAEGLLALTAALFESVDFPRALEIAERTTRAAPDMAEAWYYQALTLERLGRLDSAVQRFERAAALAPEQLPVPSVFDEFDWDGVLALALATLPERIQRFYEDITFRWDEFPAVADLLEHYPPLSPFTEALYRGVPDPDRDPWDHRPEYVHLYMANLARTVPRPEDVPMHLARALLHEALHWLGDAAMR
jgi:tetratricopeptide (TPR) repeat protein